MATSGKIGIVTVTYNSGKVLQEFLDCVLTQTHPNFVLYVVDNCSSDSTMQILSACEDPRLRVIRNSDNRGVAEGNNQGILAALKDNCYSVLLVNNDTVFDKDLLEKLSAGLVDYQADMTCPKMMYFDVPSRIWAAGGRFQPWLGYRIHQRGDVSDHGQFDEVERVSYVPTCCVLIRSGIFDKTGLMDSKYFVYMDDVDFMYRAFRADLKLIYLPECRLLHKVSSLSGGKQSMTEIRFCTRNRVYFLIKNLGLLKALPWLIMYEAYLCGRLIIFKDDLGIFKFKQRAFFNGLTLNQQDQGFAV